MGIGSLFKSGSRAEKGLRQIRNHPDHKKLAKRVEEVAKVLDTSLNKVTPSRSSTDRDKLLEEAEKVLHDTAEHAEKAKRKSIDLDHFMEEELTLLAAHQELLKMIPHITQEEVDKQVEKTREAMAEDRHRLSKQLAKAATDKSNSLDERASSMAKLMKHFVNALPSVDEMMKLDLQTRNNFMELQSVILTANARISVVHQDVQVIEVSLTDIQNPDQKTLVCVLNSESIGEEVVNRFLTHQAESKKQAEENADDSEDDEAPPDLYRREQIDKFRPGGHWWHWHSQADTLQPFADRDGKVALDYVTMEEDSYTLAVVDDGKKEVGLPLVLCNSRQKRQAGQVQKTIEKELKKILPDGRIVAIKSFVDRPNADKPLCEYALLSTHFKPRHTEFHVEVDHP